MPMLASRVTLFAPGERAVLHADTRIVLDVNVVVISWLFAVQKLGAPPTGEQ